VLTQKSRFMYRKFEREAAFHLSRWHLELLWVGALDDGQGAPEELGIIL
jgi:hypothetical protein